MMPLLTICGLTSVICLQVSLWLETRAFLNNTSLESFVVDTESTTFSSVDGVLFGDDTGVLIDYPAGKVGDYVIPSTVYRSKTMPSIGHHGPDINHTS